MKTKILPLILRAARWHPARPLVVFLLKKILPFMPFDRLVENDHWLAFHHPQPDYPLHILILPRQYMASIEDVSTQIPEFHTDFYQITQALIEQFELNRCGYRLITNGGINQLVPCFHWHLISDLNTDVQQDFS